MSSLLVPLVLGQYDPAVAFLVGLIAVILLLVGLDVPAFVGLVISAFAVGLVTAEVPLGKVTDGSRRRSAAVWPRSAFRS